MIFILLVIVIMGGAIGLVGARRRSNSNAPGFQNHLGWFPILAATACVAIFIVPPLFLRSPGHVVQIGQATKKGPPIPHGVNSFPVDDYNATNRELSELGRDLERQRLELEQRRQDIARQVANHQRQLELVTRQREAERLQHERQQHATKQKVERERQTKEANRQLETERLKQQIAQLTEEKTKIGKLFPVVEAPQPANPKVQHTQIQSPVGTRGADGARSAVGLLRVRAIADTPPAWIHVSSGSGQGESDSAVGPLGYSWSSSIDRTRFVVPNQTEGIAVSSGWYATEEEAWYQVTFRSKEVSKQMLRSQWGNSLAELPLSAEFLEQHVVRDCQIERTIKDFGNNIRAPMYRAHAWLNFDRSPYSPLLQIRTALLQEQRVLQLGIAVLGLTVCLGMFGQCLRWNIRTEGRYRRRLLALATIVAGTIVSGLLMIA